MGYAKRSEIYFAKGLGGSDLIIKIGETTNSCRRNRQLPPYLTITKSVEVGGSKAYRLWVESTVRLYIEEVLKGELVGTDTFTLKNRKKVLELERFFENLVRDICGQQHFGVCRRAA